MKNKIEDDKKTFNQVANMLSKTVHDLNNPLAVFVGQTSILELLIKQDKLSPEKLEKVITKFKSSLDIFKSRLGQFREFYKIPQQDSEFLSIFSVMKSLHYFFLAPCYDKNISFNLKFPESDFKPNMDQMDLFLGLKYIIDDLFEQGLEDEITLEANQDKNAQQVILKNSKITSLSSDTLELIKLIFPHFEAIGSALTIWIEQNEAL